MKKGERNMLNRRRTASRKVSAKTKVYTQADYEADGRYIAGILRSFLGPNLRRPVGVSARPKPKLHTLPQPIPWSNRRKRFDPEELRDLAMHEAGHCVVACKLGGKNVRAEIGCDDFYGGITKHTTRDPIDRVAVSAAGLLVDARRRGYSGLPAPIRERNDNDDYKMNRAAAGDPAIRLRGLRLASNLVSKHWNQIQSVAEWLLMHGTISDGELREIVGR